MVQPLWRTAWQFLKKLNIDLPCDPAIPLQGIYPEELRVVTQTDICTQMFIATLFMIAKSWKQPRCPSPDEWINKLWCIHMMEYYAAVTRNEVIKRMTTWMNLEDIMLSEASQTQGQILYDWEREDHPRRGREDRQHREPSEQEHRRARNSDRDRHRGHPHQKRTNERPGSGQAQGRDRDIQNLQDQETEREFYNARRREHRQKNEISGSGNESQELIPQPASNNKVKEVPAKEKPSFELSGALLEDTNTFRGVVIKYSEPPEARIPKKRWRLYPFKNDEVLPVMYIHRQSAYLLGRHRRIADIPIDHPSCSKQHAVFQYRLVEYTRADGTVGRRVRPYIIDLGSGNGTFLNNKRIEPQRYYELKEKDVLKFGFSSREYVLLHESSDTSEVDRKEDEDDEEEVVSDS
ncbi:smad nuclear-interacting protein 1 isoform X2 [Dasypus novemcinctus]|uniref:smad nuclear-interacting protein 1 isoform X2 n=1 Tax=Dasypus novemcinctus TaxID=9361 RepID=UPI00265DF055|nr:smad nuclear-interacting protein 1 isoform X1 [Dasypus novemcinctus]